MKTSFLAAALLLPLAVLAQPAPLLSATDPEGDDVGDGSLVYPRSTAWVAGDLDLRSLRVFAEGKDLRFEASLRNPVRSPATVMSPGMGTQSLSAFARHGFYAFNIDIYIDADRAPGSGNTVTLPGRRAQLDPAHAWEKAVVLAPRPELMQRELIAALREISSAGEAEVAATVQRSVFFPTQIRVQGRTVSFIVPGTFIDAAGLAGASVTAFVTAAPLAIDAGIKMSFGDTGAVRDRFALGVAQPDVGEPELTMGHRAAPAPATAVVDLLSPNPNQQALQLAPGGRLTGLSRENRMGADPLPLPAQAATAPAAATSDSWFSRALQSMSAAFGGSAATPAPAAAAAPAGTQSVQSLMSPPPAPPVSPVSPAPTAAAAVALPTAAPRLRRLRRLRRLPPQRWRPPQHRRRHRGLHPHRRRPPRRLPASPGSRPQQRLQQRFPRLLRSRPPLRRRQPCPHPSARVTRHSSKNRKIACAPSSVCATVA
ncbi:MAG: hypothetical protein IPQ21_09585 [Betaproteobacteria bacterium]|nr:hypothetical protein [Betaproteobacteria bacterium]